MLLNYIITAWRNIIKNGVFSAINIFGLSLGLMSCILITLFVRNESGYDSWLDESDRIVRMHTAYYNLGSIPLLTVRSAGNMMPAVRDYATSEVETGTRLINFPASIIQTSTHSQTKNVTPENISFVDAAFFDVFNLPFIHGNKESSFNKPLDLVITEKIAIKYFGRTDVRGETLSMCCTGPEISELTISGVIKDLPDNTHLNTELIVFVPPEIIANNPGLNTWYSLNLYTYFKMRNGVSIQKFQQRLTHWVDNESPFIKKMDANKLVSSQIKHKLMALEDLYLNAKPDAGTMNDLKPLGDAKMNKTFAIVATLILIIACINFMNLATARSSQRAKEVAMRKVLGASRTQVMIQFLAEAISLVFIALLLALVMVELSLPIYNYMLGTSLQFSLFNDPYLLAFILAIGILVGLGAGVYPAIYLSRFRPGHILKSNKSTESGRTAGFRTSLVVFQFSASIVLIICTIVIYTQTHFIQTVDLGYKSENKMVLRMAAAREQRESLKQELLNLPDITEVVFSSESPSQDNENNRMFSLLGANKQHTESHHLNFHNMDYGFFESYEIEPIAGRLFDRSFGNDEIQQVNTNELSRSSAIINQSLLAKFGLASAEEAIGRTLSANFDGVKEMTIIGVIPDIYFRSTKFAIRPSVYMLNPNHFNIASISYSSKNPAVLRTQIEKIWKKYAPLTPMQLEFLDEMMGAQYQDEKRQTQLFSAFSLLTIVIACLGLYGLAAFTTERRTKEIGIRKVMGAEVSDIVKLLVWQFSKPVLIANIVAWPIATWAMLNWLENFSYRITSIWILPICVAVGLSIILIAWVTVGGNAASVARTKPNRALRHD